MREFAPIVEMCLLQVLERKEDGLVTVCNCDVPVHVMLVEYKRLGLKIELAEDGEKKQMWEYVNEKFPKKSKEEKINLCKVIFTIGYLLPE